MRAGHPKPPPSLLQANCLGGDWDPQANAKGIFSQVLNYQVACHGSLWQFWLRGNSADEHRTCDEGLDGTFHLCHIFRREALAPTLLHGVQATADTFYAWKLYSSWGHERPGDDVPRHWLATVPDKTAATPPHLWPG